MKGTDFNMEPVYKMIEIVHAGNDEDIKLVKNIANECSAGSKYRCLVLIDARQFYNLRIFLITSQRNRKISTNLSKLSFYRYD